MGKNYVVHQELTDKQQEKYEEWIGHIKAIYGECGTLTWSVTPYGMGNGLKVYSHQTKTELDLTDVDSW